MKYPTAEHAFQAAKCVNESDKIKILNSKSPAIAKKIGRRVKLRPDWESQKVIIMTNILRIKFGHSRMRELLSKTNNCELMEQNSWHDVYWGACTCKKHNSSGKNMLGNVLMEIRDVYHKQNVV